MYDTLKRIFQKTKQESYLINAVKKEWITEQEKAEIMKTE